VQETSLVRRALAHSLERLLSRSRFFYFDFRISCARARLLSRDAANREDRSIATRRSHERDLLEFSCLLSVVLIFFSLPSMLGALLARSTLRISFGIFSSNFRASAFVQIAAKMADSPRGTFINPVTFLPLDCTLRNSFSLTTRARGFRYASDSRSPDES